MSAAFRLSPRTADLVRERYPDEAWVVALYDLEDLKRPCSPVIAYPGAEAMDALQHAWDRGCLAVSVCADGTVEGYESGPHSWELVEAAGGLTADGIAIAAAVAEYWDCRFGAEAVAKGRDGDPSADDLPEGAVLTELRRMYAEALEREGAR